MDAAIPTRIDSLGPADEGRKVRLAGQVAAFDARTGMMLLRARNEAVVLDVSGCTSGTGDEAPEWLAERMCMVTTVGYVQWLGDSENLQPPALPKRLQEIRVVEGVVVRGLLVSARRDLTLEAWHEGIAALQ